MLLFFKCELELILFTFFVDQIIDRQFNAAILGKTYQVQDYTHDQSEYYESRKHKLKARR